MDFTPLQCGLCGPPVPDNFRLSTYSVIVKQGNEQRDYVTVNYSVTLKVHVK